MGPTIGRPAWCHILGEKNVSTRSPNPLDERFSIIKISSFLNSCEINVYSIFVIIIKISCTCFNRCMHFIACRPGFWNGFT